MPTYEEVFGPTYETPIENYPNDYLNKKLVYPVRKGKESQIRFGHPQSRIDQIIEEPDRIEKQQNELKSEGYSSKKEAVALQNAEALPQKNKLRLELVAGHGKSGIAAPVTISKTSKSGDNII